MEWKPGDPDVVPSFLELDPHPAMAWLRGASGLECRAAAFQPAGAVLGQLPGYRRAV